MLMAMPTYSTGVPIMAGDWVRVLSRRTGVWHSGIVRRIYPVWCVGYAVEVLNNVKLGGVAVSDWPEFAGGETVLLHRRASAPAHVREILARAESGIGKSYNLLSQNCEHFASFAFHWQTPERVSTDGGSRRRVSRFSWIPGLKAQSVTGRGNTQPQSHQVACDYTRRGCMHAVQPRVHRSNQVHIEGC